MATFLQYKEDILRLYAQRDEAVAPIPIPSTTTTTAADALGVRDTTLARGSTNANRYDGRVIEVIENVGSGPAVGEISAVDDAGFDNTDLLTVSPAFTAALESGADYLIYPRGLTPEITEDAINEVLRNTYVPFLWIPSLVSDADFEADDLTNWAAIPTPTTRAFVTTAAHILLGERALHIVADAADQGATSNTFFVTEKEGLLLWVVGRVASGSFDVTLYDSSNSADIKRVTIDEFAFTEARFYDVAPADCEQATVRFESNANGDDFYISPMVTVQSQNMRAYPVPSWLRDPEKQVKQAVYIPQGFHSPANDTYAALGQLRSLPMPQFIRADRWVTPNLVQFSISGGYGPLGLLCLRPLAALSANTDTSTADRAYVQAKAFSNILHLQGDDGWRKWARTAAHHAEALGYGDRTIRMEPNPKVLVG